jgi:hypothetical protein
LTQIKAPISRLTAAEVAEAKQKEKPNGTEQEMKKLRFSSHINTLKSKVTKTQ